ncbi:hypothetical protein [Thermodesulfovibrio sp. TK110]
MQNLNLNAKENLSMMKRLRERGKRLKAILPDIIPKLKSSKEFI